MKKNSFIGAVLAILSAVSLTASADILLETNFDASTGHHVFAGNTDNTSGSNALAVNWTTDASVISISGLTSISTGGSGSSGGFAVTQGGTGAYASFDMVYLSRNMNLDGDRTTTQRGFSFDFTTDTPWTLDSITVVAEHTNNTGGQNQAFTSDLHYSLTGPAVISDFTNVDYATAEAWHTVDFTGDAGTTLDAGDYTLSIWMSNMPGGGAYAVFDGVSVATTAIPEPTTLVLLGVGLLAVLRQRRR